MDQINYSRSILWAGLVCVLACACASEPAPPADLPIFIPLGDLPGGEIFSEALGVSDDGTVVIGQSKSAGSGSETEAFLWTEEGGMEGLGSLPGGLFQSQALGISADGGIIVGNASSEAGQPEAFRWTRNTGMISLGDLSGGAFASGALDVSATGDLVVGWGTSDRGLEAALWRSVTDGPEPLGDLPGGSFRSAASLISTDGSIYVGTGNSEQGGEVVRWFRDGRMESLGDLPGGVVNSEPFGMTPFGLRVIVGQGQSSQGAEAFRWMPAEGMVGLGDLETGAFYSIAFGISADGTRIVGMGTTRRGEEAFIWDEDEGMRSLSSVLLGLGVTDHQRWILHRATGISSDGSTMVGHGTNPEGRTEAWVIKNYKPTSTVPAVAGQAPDATPPEAPGRTAADLATGGDPLESQQVVDTINAWAQAWSSQNVDQYLSFYAPDFSVPQNQSRADWDNYRRRMLNVPKFIKVTLSDIEVAFEDATTARVTFIQTYQSDTYRDQIRKSFQLRKYAGSWKIRLLSTSEASTPLATDLGNEMAPLGASALPPAPPPMAPPQAPPFELGSFIGPDQIDLQLVTGIVHAWAQAWSAQDVDTYLSIYASDFQLARSESREAWRKNRQKKLTTPGFIRVVVSDLKVEMVEEGTIRATFLQSYQSDTYGDRSAKTLLFKKRNSQWKIVQEQ